MSKFPSVMPNDILHHVNTALANLNIGAYSFSSLCFGVNKVICSNKKFKGKVIVRVNENYNQHGSVWSYRVSTKKYGGRILYQSDVREIFGAGHHKIPVYSSEEIESQRAKIESQKIAQRLATERARRNAVDSYRRASENGVSGYFLRKQVKPAPGIKFDSTTAIIPVCRFKPHGNKLKHVANQRIDENGQKLFNKNAEISGGFFPIGNRENPQQIYFDEGVATGLSIHQSLDNPNILVVASVGSGNLKNVVAEFARHYPIVYARHGFTLCGDNDQWHENANARHAGFKAIDAVLKQFPNCLVTYPDFDKSLADLYAKHGVAEPTDFNDFMILNGKSAVQWAVLRQAMTASEFRQLYDAKSNSLVDDDAQREFLARISADYKNRQFNRFAASALKYRIFINDFDEILKRVSQLRGEIRNNLESTNYPVARVDKQLQFVTRDDLLPQNNIESNQLLDYELAAFRDYCYVTRSMSLINILIQARLQHRVTMKRYF